MFCILGEKLKEMVEKMHIIIQTPYRFSKDMPNLINAKVVTLDYVNHSILVLVPYCKLAYFP